MTIEKKQNWFRRHWILTTFIIFLLTGTTLTILFSTAKIWNPDSETLNPEKWMKTQSDGTKKPFLDNMFLFEKLNECRDDCVGEKPEKADMEDIQILFECNDFCNNLYDSFGEEGLDEHIREIRNKTA